MNGHSQAETTNNSLYRTIRPGGRLAIIDFRPSRWFSFFFPVKEAPANRGGHGVAPELVIDELTSAGFTLEQRIENWHKQNYCLVFQR